MCQFLFAASNAAVTQRNAPVVNRPCLDPYRAPEGNYLRYLSQDAIGFEGISLFETFRGRDKLLLSKGRITSSGMSIVLALLG